MSLPCSALACAPLCLVTQTCPTLCNPMDYSLPGSSVHGDSPDKNAGVGCHALLQGLFPTQGPNPGLPHCRCLSKSKSLPLNMYTYAFHTHTHTHTHTYTCIPPDPTCAGSMRLNGMIEFTPLAGLLTQTEHTSWTKGTSGDFPGSPVVKTSPFKVSCVVRAPLRS